jgi:hypothetical protein
MSDVERNVRLILELSNESIVVQGAAGISGDEAEPGIGIGREKKLGINAGVEFIEVRGCILR